MKTVDPGWASLMTSLNKIECEMSTWFETAKSIALTLCSSAELKIATGFVVVISTTSLLTDSIPLLPINFLLRTMVGVWTWKKREMIREGNGRREHTERMPIRCAKFKLPVVARTWSKSVSEIRKREVESFERVWTWFSSFFIFPWKEKVQTPFLHIRQTSGKLWPGLVRCSFSPIENDQFWRAHSSS